MKKQTFIKLFALVLAVASIVAVTVFTVSADGAAPEIVSQNVAYKGDFALMYAVDAETAKGPVTLNLYYADPKDGAEIKRSYTVESATAPEKSGLEIPAYIFQTEGVAAAYMTKNFYVQAVDADGAKSAVKRYSVAEYLYERLADDTCTEKQIALYKTVIDFGTKAQDLLTPDVAFINTYSYVTVEGGAFAEDGCSKGAYAKDTALTPVAAGVSAWKVTTYNENGDASEQILEAGKSFKVAGRTVVAPSAKLPEGTLTFDESTTIPSFVGKTLGTGGSLAVASVNRGGATTNALKFGATNDGTNDFVRIYPTYTEENVNTVIYEFDILGGTNPKYEMLIRDMNGDQIFRFFIATETVDGVDLIYIKDVTNTNSGYNFWSCKMDKASEWVNIKMVVTPDPYTLTERFTIYYNGTAIAQANTGLYVTYNNLFHTADKFGPIDFRAQGETVNEMYLDNVRVAKINSNERIYPVGTQDFESIAIGGSYGKWSKGKSVIAEDTVYGSTSHVLYFQPDSDGTMDSYNLYPNSTALAVDKANAYGFSADIKFSKGQGGSNIAYDFMVDKGGTAVFWLRFISSDGKVYIQNQKNTSEKFEIGTLDEYFNFQAGYVYMGNGVSLVHIVANGTYVGTFTAMQNTGDFPLADMTNFRFRTMSNYDYHAYMDNAFLGYCYIEQ